MCGIYVVATDVKKLREEINLELAVRFPTKTIKCMIVQETSDLGINTVLIGLFSTNELASGKIITEDIAQTILTDLPRTNSVISHSLWVREDYQNKGLAQYLMQIKEKICKECDIESMICTVNELNDKELHILAKTGWIKIGDLSGTVEMWKKEIIT
jgi:GNAT superfamily N-acetyltransferase